jgi:hypothetical protein
MAGSKGLSAIIAPECAPALRLYAGGEANFHEKWIKRRGADPVSWGQLDGKALEAAAVGTLCCNSPQALQARLRRARSRANPSSACWKTSWSRTRPTQIYQLNILPKRSGGDISYQTSIQTNTRRAMSFEDAGSSSPLHAAMSDWSTR